MSAAQGSALPNSYDAHLARYSMPDWKIRNFTNPYTPPLPVLYTGIARECHGLLPGSCTPFIGAVVYYISHCQSTKKCICLYTHGLEQDIKAIVHYKSTMQQSQSGPGQSSQPIREGCHGCMQAFDGAAVWFPLYCSKRGGSDE